MVQKLTDQVETEDITEESQMESEAQLQGAQAKAKVRVSWAQAHCVVARIRQRCPGIRSFVAWIGDFVAAAHLWVTVKPHWDLQR